MLDLPASLLQQRWFLATKSCTGIELLLQVPSDIVNAAKLERDYTSVMAVTEKYWVALFGMRYYTTFVSAPRSREPSSTQQFLCEASDGSRDLTFVTKQVLMLGEKALRKLNELIGSQLLFPDYAAHFCIEARIYETCFLFFSRELNILQKNDESSCRSVDDIHCPNVNLFVSIVILMDAELIEPDTFLGTISQLHDGIHHWLRDFPPRSNRFRLQRKQPLWIVPAVADDDER
jgi:hypothetical protein